MQLIFNTIIAFASQQNVQKLKTKPAIRRIAIKGRGHDHMTARLFIEIAKNCQKFLDHLWRTLKTL